jgi:hypothetical protein
MAHEPEPAGAEVLVSTDICLRALEGGRVRSMALPLLINYDLPLRKARLLRIHILPRFRAGSLKPSTSLCSKFRHSQTIVPFHQRLRTRMVNVRVRGMVRGQGWLQGRNAVQSLSV